ncbi:MBL fold metallo-hydrolase [Candidatus Berkelbacteria bacterium]|nr:MBL fold metallo-hydrolase [Candidatus Berkelbacteria bacterium]
MRITKYGHSCLLVEEGNGRLLFDPGSYSEVPADLTDLDAIFVTHEHPDHCDVELIKRLHNLNPAAPIVSNPAVCKLLGEQNLPATLLSNGQKVIIKDVAIEGFGDHHTPIHSSIPPIRNIGFMVAGRLFHPGDRFIDPQRPIDILALPVAGPWLRLDEAIDYALALKPKQAFPFHEGNLKNSGSVHRIPGTILIPQGITWTVIEAGTPHEF